MDLPLLPRPDSTIISSCSEGGTISPSGQIQVPYGANRTFSIIPSPGYQIESVQVNNISIGTVTAYTFINVTTNQTIFGNFTLIPRLPGYYLIVASHDQGGIIEPDGVVTVPQNGSQMFIMTALNGYKISSVLGRWGKYRKKLQLYLLFSAGESYDLAWHESTSGSGTALPRNSNTTRIGIFILQSLWI